MQRRAPLLALSFLTAASLVAAGAAVALSPNEHAATADAPRATARVAAAERTLEISTGVITRTWSLEDWRTLSVVDERTHRIVAGEGADLSLSVLTSDADATTAGLQTTITTFLPGEPVVTSPRGRIHVEVPLSPLGSVGPFVTRIIDAYNGSAGLELSLRVDAPLPLSGYLIDRLTTAGAATAHAFNAGSDWREDGWKPELSIGDAQLGDWRRDTTIKGDGSTNVVTGEWLSSVGSRGGTYQVLERVDFPSSVVGRSADQLVAGVDLTRDIVDLGTVEGEGHISNPGLPTGRHRLVQPGTMLERVFSGVARDADDEAWGYINHLHTNRPSGSWDRGFVFNSDSVDSNKISTGAKDDMNLAEVKRQAAIAKRLGADTFILDDGWQASSGDWCPDSPQCREPRGMFPARFPDSTFAAVRKAIAPMKLGLWMSIMEFHPSAKAFTRNPTWACTPLGDGGVALTIAQNNESSSEAGLGAWNPLAIGPDGVLIDYLTKTIDHAITAWNVSYFKFDFMWWLDCIGVKSADVYEYREAFVSMIDTLQRAHPGVTIQIDETNDYRLWPFESVSRGAAWFQNGSPQPPALLHNLWSMAPFIPSDTVGQSPLSAGRDTYPTSTLALLTLISHPTVKTDLTKLTSQQISTVRRWVDAYHRNKQSFRGVTYPLLAEPTSGKAWTALQVWDRDKQSGLLAAFRQDDGRSSIKVGLKAIDGKRYRIRDLVTGKVLQTVSAAQLRAGITVSTATKRDCVALLVDKIA